MRQNMLEDLHTKKHIICSWSKKKVTKLIEQTSKAVTIIVCYVIVLYIFVKSKIPRKIFTCKCKTKKIDNLFEKLISQWIKLKTGWHLVNMTTTWYKVVRKENTGIRSIWKKQPIQESVFFSAQKKNSLDKNSKEKVSNCISNSLYT